MKTIKQKLRILCLLVFLAGPSGAYAQDNDPLDIFMPPDASRLPTETTLPDAPEGEEDLATSLGLAQEEYQETAAASAAGQSPGVPGGPGMQAGPAEPPKSPEEVEREMRQEAFEAALNGLMPLRPKEIRQLLEYYDKTREAVEVPVYPYPKPEVSVIDLSLDPGVVPPVIQVAPGHVTSLNMLDVTGAPWPVQDITWGGNFEVVKPEEGGHIIRITPMSEFAYGNISMRLITLKTPVTFTIRTDRQNVHYRIDARVPEYGPFANAPLIDGGISLVSGGPEVTSILDGAPPGAAEKLEVSGVDGRTTAYLYNGKTYVRTPLTLLSPGWDSSARSADGMNVYVLANTPVLLLSDKGQMMRAHLSRRDTLYE